LWHTKMSWSSTMTAEKNTKWIGQFRARQTGFFTMLYNTYIADGSPARKIHYVVSLSAHPNYVILIRWNVGKKLGEPTGTTIRKFGFHNDVY
jgi:hypothetical protein